MKPGSTVAYFPVDAREQALLLRVRELDFAGGLPALVEMIGQIAEARLTPAELEQAMQLLVESRQGEGLDARFANLEGRLRERIEKGLAEIEGRLSKRFGSAAEAAPMGANEASSPPEIEKVPPRRVIPKKKPAPRPPVAKPPAMRIPKEATIAFAIGDELIWGASAAQFYIAIWRWLIERGHLTAGELPIRSGRSRYAVAKKPVHPNGNEFVRAEKLADGIFIEVNLARSDIIRRAKRYLTQRGVIFDVMVGTEG